MEQDTTELDLIKTALLLYAEEGGVKLKDDFKTEEELHRFNFDNADSQVIKEATNEELFHFKVIAEAIMYFQMGYHPDAGLPNDINIGNLSDFIKDEYKSRHSLEHDGYSFKDQEEFGIYYRAYEVPLMATRKVNIETSLGNIMNEVFPPNGSLNQDDDSRLIVSRPFKINKTEQVIDISKPLAKKQAIKQAMDSNSWNHSPDDDALISRLNVKSEINAESVIGVRVGNHGSDIERDIDLLFLSESQLLEDAIKEIPDDKLKDEDIDLYRKGGDISGKKKKKERTGRRPPSPAR